MGETPTCEDIIKYHSQKTKLLVTHEAFALPMEVQVARYIEDGEYFAHNNGFGYTWFKTSDLRVEALFPPPIVVPILTVGAVRKALDKIKPFDEKLLKQAASDLGLALPKKKRKKKCKP